MRYVLFTDIHSCSNEFQNLIDSLNLNKGDVLAGFSDLLDKGPDPGGTMRILRDLRSKFETHLVVGNHCYRNFRFRKHIRESEHSAMKMKRSQELKDNYQALSDEDFKILDSARLYFIMPEFDSILIHAGIPGSIKNLPPNLALTEFSKKEFDFYGQIWFTRFVNPDGYMVYLNQQKPEDRFWTDVYDGRFGTIYYGHHQYSDKNSPVEKGLTIGFDLGCVYGGHLTAVILDCESKKRKYVSVKARQQYFKET